MVKKFLLLFSIIFFCLISLNFVSAVTNVTQCGNLTNATETYTLNQSISVNGDDCLIIENNSIVLDCQGYNITLNGADTDDWRAVDNELGYNDITVKNCVFLQNFTGTNQSTVTFLNSANSTIFNNTFEVSGIFFESSINANITGNTINNSIGAAISLFSGSNSSVVENNNITTVSMGISVEDSYNINISSNNITSSETGLVNQSMIRLESSGGAIIDYNTITTSGERATGISMESSSDVIVDLNTITTSGVNATGIVLDDSTTDINITSNNITTSGISATGILAMTASQSNLLFNNTITTSANESVGIHLDEANNMNVSSNTITTSGYQSDGIRLQGSNDSMITQNTIQTGHADVCVINIGMSGYNNTLYDNIFNTSSNHSGACLDEALANIWNTTEAVATNIMGGPNLGGNFWTNNASTGYSDTCIDSDGDYICDDPYNLTDAGNNVDYLPLANHTNMISACNTLDVANKIYYLNQSITGITATCFNITANNITLDFAGFNMTGDGTGAGVNITGYNSTTVLNGSVYNFSNGIYISSSLNNAFTNININDSKQDAIFLTGATSDNNNFTNIIVTNTNSSYYDIKFGTADIDGTWIININFANYTFTGAGGLVNFKEPSFGEIKFLQAINGSGTNLSIDVDIESNSVFVNSSNNVGLNKSANITLYGITHTDPKPQYSSDGFTFTDCTTTTDPSCAELGGYSGGNFKFNTSHFTYFKSAEAYSAPSGGGGGSSPSRTQIISLTTTEQTYTKLANYNKLEFELGGNTHLLTVKKVYPDRTKVDFIIESNPTYFTLKIDESKTIDVGESESLYVKLVSITSSRADIIVKKIIKKKPLSVITLPKKEEIKEEVLEEVPAIEEEIVSQLPEEERKPTIDLLIISLASLIIIITLVTYFIILKKKKPPF